MRRMLGIAGGIVLMAAIFLFALRGEDEPYLVRAVFDNGSFVVPGVDVRVAGARVGSVETVDVTLPGETASEDGGEAPAKAVVILRIDDPAFQDFRADASCQVRPQSLIGERYIDCRPTLPRPPETSPPPPLPVLPAGDPGEGQRLLPLERNGKTVDLDLVNNVLRRPYAERLRLVLNDLGAGFAARGEDLAVIVRRSNPALRDVDRLIKILADQSRELTRLAGDSERILAPLARERAHVAGFVGSAGATAQAAAERGRDLEADLRKLPGFLRQLRLTMREIGGFSNQALPVVGDLDRATPALTTATRKFTPFASASIRSLRGLGRAADEAGPLIREIRPAVRKARRLARTGARPLTDSSRLLESVRETRGFEHLMDLIYNTAGSYNGFDAYGHYLRSVVIVTNCIDYWANRFPQSECVANFLGGPAAFGAAKASAEDGDPEQPLLDFLLGP